MFGFSRALAVLGLMVLWRTGLVSFGHAFYFGLGDDAPIVGDWNGDGCDTLGIYRPSEARVYLSNVLATRFADAA